MNKLTKKVYWDEKNKFFRVSCKEYPTIIKSGKTESEAIEAFNKYLEDMWHWESKVVLS